jgi:prepilin-type N-terminal cleavage/methylation domain-containing protein
MSPCRFRITDSRARRGAFSLIEIIAAIAVLAVISLFLVSLSDQAGRLWSQGETRNQYRQKARAALDFMARDLRLAFLGVDPASSTLQFAINPPGSSLYQNHDTIFWQAPIATSPDGGLAEVGYFVRWTDGQANLCRFFVNPTETGYLIYSTPNEWMTGPLLTEAAPGDSANNYRGLFLENVIGMWVQAFKANDTNNVSSYSGDSRQESPRALPSKVVLSLVVLDKTGASKIKAKGAAGEIESLVASKASAAELVLSLPPWCRPHVRVTSISVSLDNAD